MYTKNDPIQGPLLARQIFEHDLHPAYPRRKIKMISTIINNSKKQEYAI